MYLAYVDCSGTVGVPMKRSRRLIFLLKVESPMAFVEVLVSRVSQLFFQLRVLLVTADNVESLWVLCVASERLSLCRSFVVCPAPWLLYRNASLFILLELVFSLEGEKVGSDFEFGRLPML